MAEFHCCNQCNRKYKRLEKLQLHIQKKHPGSSVVGETTSEKNDGTLYSKMFGNNAAKSVNNSKKSQNAERKAKAKAKFEASIIQWTGQIQKDIVWKKRIKKVN